MKTIVKRCEEIAKTYPYSSGAIFGLYNLISDCKKYSGLKPSNEDDQFKELVRILDFSGNYAVNPSSVIDFVYSNIANRTT